ncbi:MAG TPA: hypothetical protein VED86_02305 [archaeon]|nr:hypothetical protein [archaeon]
MRQRLSGNRRTGGTLWEVGYVLAMLGGILTIVLSLASLLHYPINLPLQVPLTGYFGIGVISLILGVVAVLGSKRVNQLIWGVILLAVGFLVGGVGGLLAMLGGVAGLLSRYL